MGKYLGENALIKILKIIRQSINTVTNQLAPVYTTIDSIPELWNLIPRQPFTLLCIRGGTNLFGQNGNYIGTLQLVNGVITGVMVDHWTGKSYVAIGSTYTENDIHFYLLNDMDDHFPYHSHLSLNDPNNLGRTDLFKNSNTSDDYGTVIQDWYDDGTHVNFEIRKTGVFVNKIDKDGNSIVEKTICTL